MAKVTFDSEGDIFIGDFIHCAPARKIGGYWCDVYSLDARTNTTTHLVVDDFGNMVRPLGKPDRALPSHV